MPEMQSPKKSTAALRSALIGYGVLAFTFFAPSRTLVLWGLISQVIAIVLRWLIERRVRDPAVAGQALMVVELLADGVTVALFAIATLGGIMRFEEQI
jgi:hypothetical protein